MHDLDGVAMEVMRKHDDPKARGAQGASARAAIIAEIMDRTGCTKFAARAAMNRILKQVDFWG